MINDSNTVLTDKLIVMLRADNELALEETFGKKLHKQAKIKSRDHLISAILQELQTEDVRRKRKYSTRNSVVSRCETKEEEAKQSKQNREKSAKLQSLDDLNDKITRIINDISVSCRIN